MIQRIFYPIGQGAFYAEKHAGYTFVYDCGNWKKTKQSEKLIRQSFTPEDVIDVLFISHLDWDHISGVETLVRTVKEIKNVVLPLIDKAEKNVLHVLYAAGGHKEPRIVFNPETLFPDSTNLIFVEPSSDESSIGDEVEPSVSMENLGNLNGTMKEFAVIGMDGSDWLLIPYNRESKARKEQLKQKLSSYFDYERLSSDSQYGLDILDDRNSKNKLKKIYESLDGDINSNSLILYSGCINGSYKITTVYSPVDPHLYWLSPFSMVSAPSCIYTGDSDLKEVSLNQVFGRLFSSVGTIQVPHHGSIKSFNLGSLLDKNNSLKGKFFPASFGTNNTYGHPSFSVVSDICAYGGFFVPITENTQSGFIQILRKEASKE